MYSTSVVKVGNHPQLCASAVPSFIGAFSPMVQVPEAIPEPEPELVAGPRMPPLMYREPPTHLTKRP